MARLRRFIGTGFLVALIGLLLLPGCDRPFVEQSVPEVSVVSPDTREVQEDANINLVVTATSFRDVQRLTLGGMDFQAGTGDTWSIPVELQPGINRLLIESFDSDDVVGLDTVQYLHLPITSQVGALIFPDPR
ncbi:MAG: hypothetical protein HKN29_02085, partial [Rhodothermales bacterium]|nr:hypothetical protein [Rhodothermales bacterium]